jgi:hypothetical protein|tara:strand:- start:482 stop:715 length:234 start_codon:yes stop_codon:yes gene_type:complete
MIFQDTPNPNAKKIEIDHAFEVSTNLSNKDVSEDSELNFFVNHEGIKNLFTGPGFITLMKHDEYDWESIIKDFNNYT